MLSEPLQCQLLATYSDFTDNDSLSSTFAVDDTPRKSRLQDLADEESERLSSRVCFDFSRNIVHESTKEYEEITELWYSRSDYVEMRQSMKVLAKQAIDHDQTLSHAKRYKTVLLKAFHACCHASQETDTCELEKKDEALLKKLLSNPFRIGMGAICVMSLQADKVTRRRKLVAAVCEAQMNMPRELNYSDRADFIKRVAEDISRPSRLMARRVASKQCS
jgi:hypothetical protein